MRMTNGKNRLGAVGQEVRRVVRFGFVGLAATGIHILVALVLNTVFAVEAQLANLAAFGTAILLSFFGHHSFSFRSEKSRSQTLPRFFVAAGSGYLASAFILSQLQSAEYQTVVSLVVSALFIPAVSYVVNRFWVF